MTEMRSMTLDEIKRQYDQDFPADASEENSPEYARFISSILMRLPELWKVADIARLIRDDVARTVDIAALKEWNSRQLDRHIREVACSAVMKAENVVALDAAVKAVFDDN